MKKSGVIIMIRRCTEADFPAMFAIINDAASAYRGVIPADRWHEPYMPEAELRDEIAAGVVFSGLELDGQLVGVMGIQDKGEVALIRHAYVRTAWRGQGIGSQLLEYLQSTTAKPILIGTWAAASWAVRFYRKHGYRLIGDVSEKNRLLNRFWGVPERQVETSVVLADAAWVSASPLPPPPPSAASPSR